MAMSRQEQLAAFLDQHINLPRDQYPFVAGLYPAALQRPQQRPPQKSSQAN